MLFGSFSLSSSRLTIVARLNIPIGDCVCICVFLYRNAMHMALMRKHKNLHTGRQAGTGILPSFPMHHINIKNVNVNAERVNESFVGKWHMACNCLIHVFIQFMFS